MKTFSARSSAVFASPGRTTVNRFRKRSSPEARGCSVMLSLHPMENVADDRPARRARRGILSENPVLVRRVERAVLSLQRYPRVHEGRERLVAFTNRIGERHT